ncbi:hypothetical protein PPERSA_02879 [Pseudocohnilembus persalinus]|uniref:Uncharacterized protein n=1 Tax=Pseudocohnilembus persalinus TaxID=266149 RepID=A0A0V0QMY9_PSEPJ|nr:hypothetical protein PPERSA_02879 [Pseudocohnilembus persalinus]|eukprot:KRX03500.1 hypothetical protein PPERSA_02879 [Pseudocohnilembus persalinus]
MKKVKQPNDFRYFLDDKYDQKIIEEELYLKEKDYQFQIERIEKQYAEEIEILLACEDELRNDTFLKANRNYSILKDFGKWQKQLESDLKELEQNGEKETEKYQTLDRIEYQMEKVQAALEPEIKANYLPKNPLLGQLETEFNQLQQENSDLINRYNQIKEKQQDIFAQKQVIDQSLFSLKKLINENKLTNQSALDRAARIISSNYTTETNPLCLNQSQIQDIKNRKL